MRIFFIIPSMARGGAETFLRDLASYFAGKGHSVALASGGGELLGEIESGIRVYKLAPLAKSLVTAIRWIFALKVRLNDKGADIMCSNSILTAIIAFAASYDRENVCRILILHNPLKNWFFYVLKHFSRFGVEKIITVSESNRIKLLDLGVKEEKLLHIPNAVDIERFPYTEKQCDLGRPVIGVIARIEEYKGHRYLVDAIKEIERERGLHFDIYCCGDGTYKTSLEEYISSQSLESTFILMGSCRDVPSVLRKIDIFVLPSYVEAFPISILEAMSSGVPVIATTVGDIPRIITDGETGLLVEPRNHVALKNALLKLLDDRELYRMLREKANCLIKERFSADAVFAMYEGIFKSLTNSGNPAADGSHTQ